MLFVLALLLTFISSDYPCLEHLFMVSNVFEPLNFGCTLVLLLVTSASASKPAHIQRNSQ